MGLAKGRKGGPNSFPTGTLGTQVMVLSPLVLDRKALGSETNDNKCHWFEEKEVSLLRDRYH